MFHRYFCHWLDSFDDRYLFLGGFYLRFHTLRTLVATSAAASPPTAATPTSRTIPGVLIYTRRSCGLFYLSFVVRLDGHDTFHGSQKFSLFIDREIGDRGL
jgi:hypothetical protein